MTREETQKILAVIRAAYPSFYKDNTKNDLVIAVNLWHDMLIDETYQDVAMAVKSIIATNKFAPSIAEVIDRINNDKEARFHRQLEIKTRTKSIEGVGYCHEQCSGI